MEPFLLSDEIKKLEQSKRRDLNILAFFLEMKKPDIRNMKQLQATLKRHLVPARITKDFEDDQIVKAVKIAEKEYPGIWTLETINKILTK